MLGEDRRAQRDGVGLTRLLATMFIAARESALTPCFVSLNEETHARRCR